MNADETREGILHAIDLALLGEWSAAKEHLEPLDDAIAGRLFLLIGDLERNERTRTRHLSTLRHEIGNAIAIARANVEGMIDGVLDLSTTRLHGICESLIATTRLIEELKRVPEEQTDPTIKIESFNICQLITSSANALDGLAEAKRVRVLFDPCGESCTRCAYFRGDRVRTGQILRNVLINAVRYTPPGGTVHIYCDRNGPSQLTVTVCDTGPGIQSEELAHIFEPGFRGSKVATEGQGLGLSVVKHLLEAIGGEVRVISQGGAGTTFAIVIPAAQTLPVAR